MKRLHILLVTLVRQISARAIVKGKYAETLLGLLLVIVGAWS